MKLYYFNFQKLIKNILLLSLTVSVLILGYSYMIGSQELPTLKKYEPIWQGNTNQYKASIICNVVWGEEFIPELLQVLQENNVKITFFIGGQWAKDFPELLTLIVKQGHEIGNHGYAHLHPTQLSEERNWQEILKTEEIIYATTQKKTKLFHPPFRELDNRVVQIAGAKGYTTIMSSVDTIDWQRPAPQVIVNRVDQKIHKGAIILMHPTAPTVRALPEIINNAKAKGYELVTISELLASSSK